MEPILQVRDLHTSFLTSNGEVKAVRSERAFLRELPSATHAICWEFRPAWFVRAAKLLAKQAAEGQLEPDKIDEAAFASHLYTADLPDPDLIIRTGGEMRLSNFLTWQSAYSELYVTDTYWPDFTPDKLKEAIEAFNGRDRRYGGIKA